MAIFILHLHIDLNREVQHGKVSPYHNTNPNDFEIQVGFAQSAALKKLANRNVFRQHRFFSFEVGFALTFSSHFGTCSCRGEPPEPSQGCQSEAQWWQVCPDPLFHRFVIDFGVHCGRRFRTCCSV